MVDQNDPIAEPKLADHVAIGNVQVDLVEIVSGWWKTAAAFALLESGELANGRARFSAMYKASVLGCEAEVLVVLEPTIPKEVIDFVGGEVLEGVRAIRSVAGAHVRRGRIAVGRELKEGLWSYAFFGTRGSNLWGCGLLLKKVDRPAQHDEGLLVDSRGLEAPLAGGEAHGG